MSLWKLCSLGKVEEMRAALDRGENVNSRDEAKRTVLMLAATLNNVSILRMLLEQLHVLLLLLRRLIG